MILSFKLKITILLQKNKNKTKQNKTKTKKKERKEKKRKKICLDGIRFLYVVPNLFWFHRIIEMVSRPSQAPFPWFCYLN